MRCFEKISALVSNETIEEFINSLEKTERTGLKTEVLKGKLKEK